ncbi:MAG: oligosaccharide flippase family protein [Chloroflexi bacterium]|nr:oligosaccharide flippase family protein [Ardenticatenaceae bacterium]NOG34167.1 oligosaccharide flippase family protein [Chloroflexota bacterium]
MRKTVIPFNKTQKILPKTRKHLNGFAGEFLFFAAATIAFQFSRLGVNLLVARWVGPDEFGIWNALNLLLLYGVIVTLGVPNGMNRDVPIYMGRQAPEIAESLIHSSFWFTLLVTVGGGSLLTLISFTSLVEAGFQTSLRWMGLLFASWMMYQFFQLRLKCLIRFHLMSMQQFAFAILLPLLALPLAYIWHVPGYVFGQAVTAVLLCVVIASTTSFRPSITLDWAKIQPLIKVGFPIMLAGLLYSVFTTIDRWIVLKYLGVSQLGHYTLAILCVSVLSLFPAIIGQQMYPRMAFHYGETHNIRSLKPLVIKQSLIATAVTLPVILATYFLLPYLVHYMLPDYVIGIRPARILLVGISFIPLAGGVANFLNTVNKQMYYLIVQTTAIVVSFIFSFLLVKAGWGLQGIAMGTAASYILYTCLLIGVGRWILRSQ